MQIYLDLKEYNKDEKSSFYNHPVYVKKDSSNPLKIKLEFYDDESAVYCSDWYICITNLSGEIMVYNPKLKMYEKFFKASGNYTDSSSTSEMRTYLKDLEQYIHIDYKHHSDCYILDINKLLKDILPELRIQNDENHYISLYSSGVKVKCPFLRDYQDNFDYNIMRNKPDHYYASFMRPSEIYSFHNELKDFIKTSNLGSKFSDIYDKVVEGSMNKEEFLKEVIV